MAQHGDGWLRQEKLRGNDDDDAHLKQRLGEELQAGDTILGTGRLQVSQVRGGGKLAEDEEVPPLAALDDVAPQIGRSQLYRN